MNLTSEVVRFEWFTFYTNGVSVPYLYRHLCKVLIINLIYNLHRKVVFTTYLIDYQRILCEER